jgi:hypothetical protein
MAKLKDKPDAIERSRKALGQKPVVTIETVEPWKLPAPPPGKQWHRMTGWTEEMLPAGYRPLLKGERREGAEFALAKTWMPTVHPEKEAPTKNVGFMRTTRPLPGVIPIVWMLPKAPAGKRWHSLDFDEADLPPGYRPLLDGEMPMKGDEVKMMSPMGLSEWKPQDAIQCRVPAERGCVPQRTRRPLPGCAGPVLAAPTAGVPAGPPTIPTPRIDAAEKDSYGGLIAPEQRKKFAAVARGIERELVIATEENTYQVERAAHLGAALLKAEAELAKVRKELEERNHVMLDALRETIHLSEDTHSNFAQTSLAGRIALEKLGVEQPKFGNFLDGDEKEEMKKAIAKVVKKV